jgi:hypothetical protein
MSLANANQRFSNNITALNQLLESDIIKVDNDENIVINFLDNQMNEFINVSEKRAIAGVLGGKAKAKQLPEFDKAKLSYKDKDKDKDKDKIEKKTTSRFTPPNLSDVKSYCLERNNLVDAEKWFNHYTSNGWMVGKNKMKDWKAAVRTWEKNSFGTPQPQQSILTTEQLRDMNFRNQRRKIEGKEPFTPESYFKIFKGANTKGMDDNGMVW